MPFYFVIISAIIASGLYGCKAASNDFLQQVFVGRKLAQLFSELLCTALIILILWLKTSFLIIRLIPAAAAVVYLTVWALFHYVLKKKLKAISPDTFNEFRETLLRTIVSVLSAAGITLLICLAALSSADLKGFAVSANDRELCHGILIAVSSILICALCHYIIALWNYPNEDKAPSRDLLRLRKKLHSSPPI